MPSGRDQSTEHGAGEASWPPSQKSLGQQRFFLDENLFFQAPQRPAYTSAPICSFPSRHVHTRYDGAGNVTQMGHSGYDTYDGVSRLTTAVVQTNAVDGVGGNTTVSQTMSYDAFGNLQSMLGTSGRYTTTNSATNQLSGATYDSSGNLRTWNGASYDYDELDKLKHYKNGVQEWFYMYDADDERVWSFEPPLSPNPRFDRWTLRGLDGKVKRSFEVYGYNWGNAWSSSNLYEDYLYRDGLLLWIPEFGEAEAEFTIAGYTKHGINMAINKNGVGVAPKAILDAVKNPLKVIKQSDGTTKFIGKNATVVLNQAWKVVSTWARNSSAWRIFK